MSLRRAIVSFAVWVCSMGSLSCGEADSDLGGPGRVGTLALTPGTARLEPGQTLQLTVVVYDLNGAVLTGESPTWRTSNDAVATVSSAGLVTAVGTGSAGITAVIEGRSVTARISVGFAISTVEISPETPTVAVARTVQLTATARASGGTVLPGAVFEWVSSDLRVANVSVGKVRGIRPGSALITASSEGRSDTTTVTVVPAGEPPADPRIVGY